MEDDFFEIYEETYPTIVRYIVSKIDNISNVSDVVQNIYTNFYKVYKKNNKYVQNYKNFIFDLSKKEIYKYYKKRKKENEIILEIDFFELEKFVSSSEVIEIDFINKNNREIMWNEIDKFDLETKKILMLHYLQELSIKDIANILNLNENTVKTKIYRSISKLKERIGANERNS